MKKLLLILLAAFTGFAFLLAGFTETLKITEDQAQTGVWYSFADGAYSGPTSQTWKNLSVAVRVATVKEVGAYAKAYTKSEEFKKQYAQYREDKKPNVPEPMPSMKETKEKMREGYLKGIAESEANLKNFTGDARKGIEDAIKIMKEQLKQLDDPKNPMFSPEMEKIRNEGNEAQMKEYKEQMAAWEKDYPESPTAMIRSRLKYFLQISATVDFNAKLKDKDGYKVFVSQAYENQSADWKLIFRSGKESTDAAKAVATQWLNELK